MITKTTRSIRPNLETPFFRDVADTFPAIADTVAAIRDLIATGKVSAENNISQNGLIETRTWTFDSIQSLSEFETISGVEIQHAFNTYRKIKGFTVLDYTNPEERVQALEYAGIDQPYTVTTTYIFPEVDPNDYNATQIQAVFANSIESYEHYGRKVDILLTDTTVTVVHQYENSADHTANPYLDMFYIPQLAEKHVRRTIEYALV